MAVKQFGAKVTDSLIKTETSCSPLKPVHGLKPVLTFPRWVRLIRPDQFSSALSTPPRARNGRFALHIKPIILTDADFRAGACANLPPQYEAGMPWRLGLVVPKRFEASAVRRNTIKRVWREVFRTRRERLLALSPGQDLVVRLTASLKAKPAKGAARASSKLAASNNDAAVKGKKVQPAPKVGTVSGVQSAPGLIALRRLCYQDADTLLEQLSCKLERSRKERANVETSSPQIESAK